MKKNKKTLITCIIIIIIFQLSFLITVFASEYIELNNILENDIVRFRVIPNSDSKEDQDLKITLRNKVILELNKKIDKIDYNDEKNINIILNKIKEIAEDTVKSNGYNYNVKVSFANHYLNRTDYGEIVLPSGNYKTVLIEIGKASGSNWLCVMFPPLCITGFDKETAKFDDEVMLKYFSEDEYEILKKTNKGDVSFKFRLLELIKK